MDDPRDYIIDHKSGRARKDHFAGTHFEGWAWWQWAMYAAIMVPATIIIVIVVGGSVSWLVDRLFTFAGW